MKVLVVPVLINTLMIVAFTFMVILMGICVCIACVNFNIFGIVIYGVLEYSFLSTLFHWHKAAYIEIPKNRQYTLMQPSDDALSVRAISEPAVYFLQDIDVTGYVKIGRSKSPNQRLHVFGVKLPFQTRLIHVIRHKDDKMLEAFFHDFFKNQRVRGEWFSLTEMHMETIKRFNPNASENDNSDGHVN